VSVNRALRGWGIDHGGDLWQEVALPVEHPHSMEPWAGGVWLQLRADHVHRLNVIIAQVPALLCRHQCSIVSPEAMTIASPHNASLTGRM